MMVSRKEWARMCEPPLADDSGLAAPISQISAKYPERSREELIGEYRQRYGFYLSIANGNEHEDRTRIVAYEAATICVEELGILGVSPYPLNKRLTLDTES